MSYVFKCKSNNISDYFNEGFDFLPADIFGNLKIIYKIVQQPTDGECVKSLINLHSTDGFIDKVYKDKKLRLQLRLIGIKYRKRKLIITDELLDMFSIWRLEINFEEDNYPMIGFTISDGSLPIFYDAEEVIEKYCLDEINNLLEKGLIEKVVVANA